MPTFVDMPGPAVLRSAGQRLHLRMAKISWSEPEHVQLRTEFFELTAAFVEVLAFGLALSEVAQVRGASRWEDLMAGSNWIEDVGVATGISPEQFSASVGVLTARVSTEDLPPPTLDQTMQVTRRAADQWLRFFPVNEVSKLAHSAGLGDLAHRINVAFEQLSAIHRRMHLPETDTFRIVGMAYVKGEIELHLAARVLGLSRPDLLAALESHGFARPLETISLSQPQRDAILGRLREDRARRTGKPSFDAALVARDVVASQRIEGVDARRWMTG